LPIGLRKFIDLVKLGSQLLAGTFPQRLFNELAGFPALAVGKRNTGTPGRDGDAAAGASLSKTQSIGSGVYGRRCEMPISTSVSPRRQPAQSGSWQSEFSNPTNIRSGVQTTRIGYHFGSRLLVQQPVIEDFEQFVSRIPQQFVHVVKQGLWMH